LLSDLSFASILSSVTGSMSKSSQIKLEAADALRGTPALRAALDGPFRPGSAAHAYEKRA
jgi:hypothetical protein